MGHRIFSSHKYRECDQVKHAQGTRKSLYHLSTKGIKAALEQPPRVLASSSQKIEAYCVQHKSPRNNLPTTLNSSESCNTRHAAPQAHALAEFTTLPPELVLCVKANLPPSGLLSLSYTCKKFYFSSAVVVEDILTKQHTAVYDGVEEREERLAFLCMLERD